MAKFLIGPSAAFAYQCFVTSMLPWNTVVLPTVVQQVGVVVCML